MNIPFIPSSASTPSAGLSEFDLIRRYFVRPAQTDNYANDTAGQNVVLGIGDDCALMHPSNGLQMAISTDMLVEGRHFFAGTDPLALGHKALAVNLSDLAAMGATPSAFTLALALPAVETDWVEAFSKGLFALADTHDCTLIGGDTTKGPLTICITVFGQVLPGAALRRNLARPGDDIWVSGTLGDARLALAVLRAERFGGQPLHIDPEQLPQALHRLHRPTPRVALGMALRGIAHAAIDISDGLTGDLGHVLTRSKCGATIDVDALPAGPVLKTQPQALRRAWTLAGGDDYELCFSAPIHQRSAVLAAARGVDVTVTRIGTIVAGAGLQCLDAAGKTLMIPLTSFDHFTTQ